MQKSGVARSACTVVASGISSNIRRESRMQSVEWDAAAEVDFPAIMCCMENAGPGRDGRN